MHVYIAHDNSFFTVGHYDPEGKFIPESDHSEREKAAERVAFLNGTVFPPPAKESNEPTLHESLFNTKATEDLLTLTASNGIKFRIRVVPGGILIHKCNDGFKFPPIEIVLESDQQVMIS